MPDPDTLLLAALHAAPRPYRMPPLPVDAAAAKGAGVDMALAFAIEAARAAKAQGRAPPTPMQELFTTALADLVRAALVPAGGDPAFQALLLHARAGEVREHVQLGSRAASDRREVRAIVDAIAHPGKLRALAPGPLPDALAQMHALATHRAWRGLRDNAALLLAEPHAGEPAREALATLLASPALDRLERADALLRSDVVQRYQALCSRRGPLAGSDAAAAHGRASARLGERAEAATVEAFHRIAEILDRVAAGARHRVVQGLRMPRGFPGAGAKAKEEWDAAIVRGEAVADLVLLAEVKASPAAATPDFPRLLRGLHRLAQADGSGDHVFPCHAGEVRIRGDSLRRLQPPGHALPPHVIYCCTAPVEAAPPVLSAASKAVLLAEPATLAFAERLHEGAAPSDADLVAVWEALTTAPRLRSALHQFETAQTVRSAMLRPQELVDALIRATTG